MICCKCSQESHVSIFSNHLILELYRAYQVSEHFSCEWIEESIKLQATSAFLRSPSPVRTVHG